VLVRPAVDELLELSLPALFPAPPLPTDAPPVALPTLALVVVLAPPIATLPPLAVVPPLLVVVAPLPPVEGGLLAVVPELAPPLLAAVPPAPEVGVPVSELHEQNINHEIPTNISCVRMVPP
jgi:hypothetical protein